MEIYVKNVSKKFGIEEVLKNINFEIKEGEGILIYGKNGAGKTTLLKILNFLENPTEGEIVYFSDSTFLFNKDTKRNIDFQKKMVFIPQKPVIFSTSVVENVKIGLKIRGEVNSKSEKKVNEMLEDFEISEIKNKFAHFLSSGQKKRVSLIRGLLLNTELILLDEPTNNLDERGKDVLKNILIEKKSRGVSFIISTPDLNDWDNFYFEKVYRIEDGDLNNISKEKDNSFVRNFTEI